MSSRRKRILFVDDDTKFLDGIRRVLHDQRNAWDMVFATSADQAQVELNQGSFDAVVTDVKMPGKDGFKVLSLVKESEMQVDVPVIILTGLGDNDLKTLALSLGAHDLLSKPIATDDLLARLRSALRLKAAQDDLREVNGLLEQKVAERTSELERSRRDIVWRLAKVGEFRDGCTGNHIVRVGCYARIIAEALGLARSAVEQLFLSAPLHDIGKIGIPDAILRKPGPLTPAETLVMREHCIIGAGILLDEPNSLKPFLEWRGTPVAALPVGDNQLLAAAATVAMTHHERWDGHGYPAGLAGEDIPLSGRIAAVADVYDAVCSTRPYKEAMPEEDARHVVIADSGTHFDPAIVEAFDRVFNQIRVVRLEFRDEVHLPA